MAEVTYEVAKAPPRTWELDEEPMPESQDLCMEHGSIPETLPNRVEQREDDREHGICKL